MTWREPRAEWRDSANCDLESAHLFGPVDQDDRGPAFLTRLADAGRVCAGCPVSVPCRAQADAERLSGVFGGVYLSHGEPRDPSQVRVAGAA